MLSFSDADEKLSSGRTARHSIRIRWVTSQRQPSGNGTSNPRSQFLCPPNPIPFNHCKINDRAELWPHSFGPTYRWATLSRSDRSSPNVDDQCLGAVDEMREGGVSPVKRPFSAILAELRRLLRFNATYIYISHPRLREPITRDQSARWRPVAPADYPHYRYNNRVDFHSQVVKRDIARCWTPDTLGLQLRPAPNPQRWYGNKTRRP